MAASITLVNGPSSKFFDIPVAQEKEASEQIFLFDRQNKSEELSNLSNIIGQIRNKQISIQRAYVPEEYKELLIGG